ncbi:helix-turn-helix transcriptional regulator [Nocardia sp. NPDC057227]|uniref:helix-turn-helix transcriptional regulator n=1 Tax=Nocardia sp. NPDC057227 TaxID=3346056 RepID=UPI00362C3F4A
MDGARLERSCGDERRAAIMALAFGWLTGNRAPDEPRRLLTLQDDLGGSADAVRDVLTQLYDTPWASVEDVVATLGCRRRSLQRALTTERVTFRALRQAVRLTTAGYRLRTTGDSMTRIAHDAGFFDSAHFFRAWRTACGVPPSLYRSWAAA